MEVLLYSCFLFLWTVDCPFIIEIIIGMGGGDDLETQGPWKEFELFSASLFLVKSLYD